MVKNRREIEMALRVLITVLAAVLEMLENANNTKENVLIGKDGE